MAQTIAYSGSCRLSSLVQAVKTVADCQVKCRLLQTMVDMYVLVCSVISHPERVATKLRLAFQAKAMVQSNHQLGYINQNLFLNNCPIMMKTL